MIVIEKINYFEIDRDMAEIMHMRHHEPVRITNGDGSPSIMDANEVRELIRGHRFVRSDGMDIVVGMSEQAAYLIGIQYEAWERMEKDLDFWRESSNGFEKEISGMSKKINYLELPWWKKIFNSKGC